MSSHRSVRKGRNCPLNRRKNGQSILDDSRYGRPSSWTYSMKVKFEVVLFPGRPDPARAFFGTARAWLEHIRPETARLETGPGRLRAARNWPGPFRAGLSSGLGLMARAGSGQKARIIFNQF